MTRVAIIGDGWAALGAAGFAVAAGHRVTWISASGGQMIPALPMLESGVAAETWKRLAEVLDVDVREAEPGSYLREFRNKAFREPTWSRAPTPEARRDARDELLWAPERAFAPVFEVRFEVSLAELEQVIRSRVLERVERVEGIPVGEIQKMSTGADGGFTVTLSSGAKVLCDQLVYADKWSLAARMPGLPKSLSFLRKRSPLGVLQAEFIHRVPVGQGAVEGFMGLLHKEAGEEYARSVLGYFLDEGKKSVWTLFLAADETEDNHEIAKKLRRMKSTLDKMFTGTTWLGENSDGRDFNATVTQELVRFNDSFVFSEGESPVTPIQLPHWDQAWFLTDGYGPSAAMVQVAEWTRAAGMAQPGLAVPSVQATPDSAEA